MLGNPIILKECLQSARQWRTYALRSALPLMGMIALIPGIGSVVARYGQDWRAMAKLSRTFFQIVLWGQLGAFSLAAFAYCAWIIRVEWRRRTMEVLCASPLTRMQIVYGKYAAALLNVLMIAVAVLPVMGLWYQLSRMPPGIAFGALAVILGSVLFLSAVSLLQAVLTARGKWFYPGLLLFTAPYYIALIVLNAYVWPGRPLLEAAIAPRAMFLLLTDAAPGTLTAGGFAWLSFRVHAALAVAALAPAPWLFGRSVSRALDGRLQRWKRLRSRRRTTRPRLRMREDPLFWQEKGSSARMLRRTPLRGAAIAGFFLFLHLVMVPMNLGFVTSGVFWLGLIGIGTGLLTLMPLLYGVTVTAREKHSGRCEALLLTGRSPLAFFLPKLRMVYLSMWDLILVMMPLWWGVTLAAGFDTGYMESWTLLAWLVAATALVAAAPLLGLILGLVFGVVARSGTQALLGLLSTAVWTGVLAMFAAGIIHDWEGPGWPLLWSLVLIALLLVALRRWTPIALGLLLGLTVMAVVLAITFTLEELRHAGPLLLAIGALPAWAGISAAWLWLLTRFYEYGMSGQPVRLWKRSMK